MRRSLALVALLLAGCVDPAADDAPPGTDAMLPPVDEGLRFLTADMALSRDAPADGAVRAGSFFRAWAEGADYVTWESAPFDADRAVTELSVHLALRATGPVATSGRFPDVMVYGGSGGSWIAFASQQSVAPVLVPGTVYAVDLALAVPEGGLVVPRGEKLGLKVVPVMHQNEAADIEVLVGPEGSTATWTAAAVALPALDLAGESYDGEVAGSAYAGDAAPPSTRHRAVATVPATKSALLVWMNTTGNEGIPDIDLSIVGPDGVEVASSGTPTPREFVRLMAPNLREAGEYTIVVASYGSARASFHVDWLAG